MCVLTCFVFGWSASLTLVFFVIFFFKQKTAYEMRISDWSSDVCSSDLKCMGSTIRRISDGRHSESHAEQRLPVVLRQQASRRFIEVRMGINKAWNDRLTLKIYHVHVNRDSYTITGSDLLNA